MHRVMRRFVHLALHTDFGCTACTMETSASALSFMHHVLHVCSGLEALFASLILEALLRSVCTVLQRPCLRSLLRQSLHFAFDTVLECILHFTLCWSALCI